MKKLGLAFQQGGVWEGSPPGQPICLCPSTSFSSPSVDLALRLFLFVSLAFTIAFGLFVLTKTVAEAKSKKKKIRRMSEMEVKNIHEKYTGIEITADLSNPTRNYTKGKECAD